MTTPYLTSDIKLDEGFRANAYPDPISHGDPWTIGYGHTGKNVHPGLVWTTAVAADQLASDLQTAQRALDASLPWWRKLDDVRQDVIVNMAYNMGVATLITFTTYLHLVENGEYAQAADDELHTLWAKQVGERAVRLSEQMRTGVRA